MTEVGAFPVDVLVANGFVWVTNHESDTVSRVDPSDGSRIDI
jgi:DNA-binding beta-propeller fold protein YncE